MAGRFGIQFIDADGDRKETSLPTEEVAADGTNYVAWLTNAGQLQTAIGNVTVGNVNRVDNVSSVLQYDASAATNNFAQSTTSWRIEFSLSTDGTPANKIAGGPYGITIPTADLSAGIARNGRIELDLGAGVGLALKDAFEAHFRDTDGNFAIVESIFHRED